MSIATLCSASAIGVVASSSTAGPCRQSWTPKGPRRQAGRHATCRTVAVRAAPARQGRRQARAVAVAAAPPAVDELVLQPISKIEGHVKLPGSKSLSNRMLLLAALADGITTVENILVRRAGAGAATGLELSASLAGCLACWPGQPWQLGGSLQ